MTKNSQRNPMRFKPESDKPKHVLLAKRQAAEKRFRLYGLGAIAISTLFLVMLVYSIVSNGYTAFLQTQIRLPIYFDAALIDQNDLQNGKYRKLVHVSLKKTLPGVKSRRETFQLYRLMSDSAAYQLRKIVMEEPEIIGTSQDVWLTASSDVDIFVKGRITREVDASLRKITDRQIGWIDTLQEQGTVRKTFNTTFFTSGDSRTPEQAGVLGAMVGSFFTILVCMIVSFPLGVGAAIYLEEFAPKNRLTEFIEIQINNLAAVPSIIFGLLALSVYLNLFGLPRSSSLVGGLALSMLVLPTIVITTRNALKAVPPSIRDAATALGASDVQVALHHTVQYALPGIMTGTILSIARALGETAPLLMIGMVAFVADVPGGFTDPATSLPVQVYLWADSPELGFAERTAACIIVLLAFLAAMNALAVYLRKKYEYTW